METMTCKECGKELPITSFKTTRWGTKAKVCTECAYGVGYIVHHANLRASINGKRSNKFHVIDYYIYE